MPLINCKVYLKLNWIEDCIFSNAENSAKFKITDSKFHVSIVTLRMNIKMFNGNNLPHELFLTTRQKTELRNAFENKMSTDVKLSRAQISKIISLVDF